MPNIRIEKKLHPSQPEIPQTIPLILPINPIKLILQTNIRIHVKYRRST